MSDKQPLLEKSSKLSRENDDDAGNTNNKRTLAETFSYWRGCFCHEDVDNKYKNLDDDTGKSDTNASVGVFYLFRFAHRIDLFFMFIAACLIILHGCCFLINVVTASRLTALLIIRSSDNNCSYQDQNSLILNMSNYNCSLGIELNSTNYDQLHQLCHNIDKVLSSRQVTIMSLFRETVMHLVHRLFIVGAIDFVITTIGHMIWSVSVKRQTSCMRVRLFESLIQRNIAYWDKNPATEFNVKLFDNITTIEQGIGSEFLILIANLFSVVGGLIIALVINWQLSLIMLCLTLVIIGSTFIFFKVTANATKNELNTYSKAGQIVQEVFSSLRTVLSLNGTKFEQKRYEKELKIAHWSSIRKGATFGLFVGWLSLTGCIANSLGFISGSIIMSHDNTSTLNISDIIVVITMFTQIIGQFSLTGPFIQSFSEARNAAIPVFQLIDEGDDINKNEREILKDSISDKESIDINGDIVFENVNFAYPSRKDVVVLNNLCLIARAGETTALVGSNGSGKSTCISLLLRFYELSSGHIMINDRSIKDYNIKQFRQNIGVVSQEPVLFGMSIYENIRFGKISATREEIEEAAKQANAHNFIMQLPNKYETLVGERGIQLSGGEKQRIALARALVKKPTLLLLDEATSALDNVNEKIVQEELDRACKNRATIIIAHRLSTIQNVHNIYVLDKGNVIEQGTHEILMANERGKYKEMVKSQQIERTNDEDNLMSMEKVIEEDEKQISERSHLLNTNEAIDMNKESSTSSNRPFIFFRLLSMNGPEWITILIGCIACLLNGISQPIFTILFANLISAFQYCTYSEQHRRLLTFGLIFFIFGLIVMFLRFVQYTAFAISGSKLTQRICSKAFACLFRQEIAYFDQPENSSGSICTRLSSEAIAVQRMAASRLGVICETLSMFCFGLLFSILVNWQLTIIVFIPILIFIIICYLNIRSGMLYNQKSKFILGRTSSLAVEVINNMRTIKQLSVEKEVLRQYSQFIHQLFILSRKFFLIFALAYGIFWGINWWILACFYWRALVLIEQTRIKSSDITMILAIIFFATRSLVIFGTMSRQIGASFSAVESFFDLFDRTPVIDNTSNKGQKLDHFHGKIEFDQVKFAYPTRPTSFVLNNFQLRIKPGQRVALVGASGCGKSTILQLLERFYDVTHGQLFLDDIDIRKLNINWLRSRFGLVSQEPVLFDLTIAENIAYGLENVPMEDIINAALKVNIHYFIEQLPQGYETKVGIKGSLLSGGEKQRIAIARALLRQPKVLLFDEPTSAMDSYNEQIIQQVLEQVLTEDSDRTSLIIAHRLSTIRSCDLICVLDKGHIVESGTHTELILRRGLYYNMLAQNNP